jgi:Tfp pilus assembly protein PilF
MTDLERALEYHRSGRLAEAEKVYRTILARETAHPDALHMLGVIAAQRAEYGSATILIEQAIASNASVADYHNDLGIALQMQGHLDRAVAAYRRAIALKPSFESYSNCAAALRELGKLDEAITILQEAIALEPGRPEGYKNLDDALEAKARSAEAVTAYQRKDQAATERPPTTSDWIFIVGMPRSGSTWVYNIVSEVLVHQGRGQAHGYVGEGADIDQYLKTEQLDQYAETPRLIKFHSLTSEAKRLLSRGLAKAIYSQRDLRDVAVSLMDFDQTPFDDILASGRLEALAKSSEEWAKQPNTICIEYSAILERPEETIIRLASWLGYPIIHNKASDIAVKWSLGASRARAAQVKSSSKQVSLGAPGRQKTYHRDTLLHHNHIASGKIGRYRDCLSSDQVTALNDLLGDWLIAQGYETVSSRREAE